ncbi:hypothetical protein LTR08_007041 [Meristemomyces frigidus]|nr:hypothetical protein LTR08_007041 [Meristemomyces frigidus]
MPPPSPNRAAWIPAKHAPFTIADAPMPQPGPTEIVIRAHAVAFNPVDPAIQKLGMVITTYPTVIGCDVAGQITALGTDVVGFAVGDRVLAMLDHAAERSHWGAFQLYCAASAGVTAKLPAGVAFTRGCVLPVALSTAAMAVFSREGLGLKCPRVDEVAAPNGRVVLVWGGSSSVGSCAIQMVRAAGYAVATTCGRHNFEYCRDVGAEWVFDYRSASVVEDIVSALQASGKVFAGAFDAVFAHIGECGEVAHRLGGKKHVATILPGPPTPMVVAEGLLPEGVGHSYCYCTNIKHDKIGPAIWGQWVTPALAKGTLRCKPEPKVVGRGLEAIQEACDRMSEGVSATKLVVEIL